jgi:sulfide:quinone oxidoreductase
MPGSALSRPGRRDLLRAAAAAGLVAPLAGAARAQPLRTPARVVIAGAGAAGLTMASKLSRLLDGARITLIGARASHWYQPGFTMVASGVWPVGRVVSETAGYVAPGVTWVRADVAAFEPEARRVIATDGSAHAYDALVVATGCTLEWSRIEGMDPALIGREGIASVYAGPEGAEASWRVLQRFMETGGVALHGRPPTEMKCAGAPLKVAMLWDARAREAGTRGRAEIRYFTPFRNLFAVAPVHARVLELFGARDIPFFYEHTLTALDPGAKTATFRTPDGPKTLRYDYLHVVPPMAAPKPVRESALAWQSGPLAEDGWVEANRDTLHHPRFPEVFAVGDVAGVPRGKTAASVKTQAPVVAANLVAFLAGSGMDATYNGYTSCPLITRPGRAMLVEFDYEGRLIPTFPFIDPLAEHWVPWVMKDRLLGPIYRAMLHGRI